MMENKYLRNICTIDGKIDVYAVLEAFNVTCPARQHAIKKLLCAGIRGKGDVLQDLKEAGQAITRAIQMEEQRKQQQDKDDTLKKFSDVSLDYFPGIDVRHLTIPEIQEYPINF